MGWAAGDGASRDHHHQKLDSDLGPSTGGTRIGRRTGEAAGDGASRDHHPQQLDSDQQKKERRTVSTLLVPYTVGSVLQKKVQAAEDDFLKVVGGIGSVSLKRGATS